MTDKQVDALRLADSIEAAVEVGRYQVGGVADCAAAELRRLHALNAELLEAAKGAAPLLQAMLDNIRNTLPEYQKMPALDNLRAAITALRAALAEPGPQGGVEVELLQADLDRHQQTIIEMGAMLRAIVNLIRGEPPEGESHSTHDAVELVRQLAMHNDLYVSAATHEINALKSEVKALRAALAEPQDEPVAKVEVMTTGGNAGLATRIVEIDNHLRERLRPGQLLYTHPAPQRQPTPDLMTVVEWILDAGHMNQELLAQLRAAWEAAHGTGSEA